MWSQDQFCGRYPAILDNCSNQTESWSMLLNHHPDDYHFCCFFSASKNNRLCTEFWFSTEELSNSQTFPDNWWITNIPRLSRDWKVCSDFSRLAQFPLTWRNPDCNAYTTSTALHGQWHWHSLVQKSGPGHHCYTLLLSSTYQNLTCSCATKTIRKQQNQIKKKAKQALEVRKKYKNLFLSSRSIQLFWTRVSVSRNCQIWFCFPLYQT